MYAHTCMLLKTKPFPRYCLAPTIFLSNAACFGCKKNNSNKTNLMSKNLTFRLNSLTINETVRTMLWIHIALYRRNISSEMCSTSPYFNIE